ncbi:MAG: tRNA pseudouridine(38-40) synthase [Acidimicrobiaceae bacterium]|nr:tRNA pseudouridine(38-40) synthase [Acidimicrobiaceae bacterium]
MAGAIVAAVDQVAGAEVQVTCAGRTDAGVHALAQVVHIDLEASVLEARFATGSEPGTEIPGLARSLTSLCGPGIVVWRAVVAPDGFDARRSATARRYRYDLELGERGDPLRRNFVWHVGGELDLAVLRIATDPILGEHDFGAFCRRPPDRPTGPITRRVSDARWSLLGDGLLRFEIEAGSFCHQMVRSLVGALVAAGQGRIRPSDLVTLLHSGRRDGAPTIAPPRGLCLVAVRYPEALGGTWC